MSTSEVDHEDPAPQTGRRRRTVLVAAGVLVLALIVAGVVIWATRGADEVDTDAVVEDFRSGSGTTDTTEPSDELLRPAEGVYTYAAEGSESLSVLGTTQEWGPTMPATVRHLDDGCWSFRLEYSTHHRREQELCPDGDRLVERVSSGYQAFDFGVLVENSTTFRCDPPDLVLRLDAEPGEHWATSCEGESSEGDTPARSEGTTTFVGTEDLDIGGRRVPALHLHLERVLSGSQQGTQDDHLWFSPDTGLLLRARLDIEAVSPSPIGDVTYRESGEFVIDSLEPRR